MKKFGWILVTFLLCFLCTGCVYLSDYTPRIHQVQVSTSTTGTVYVDMGEVPVNGIAGIVANTASVIVSQEQEARMSRLVTPKDMTVGVEQNFISRFSELMHIPVVPAQAQHEALISIVVRGFGAKSYSVTAPMQFYIKGTARVIYEPESKKVWERNFYIEHSLSELELYGSKTLSAISAAINLSLFFSLSDSQIQDIFYALSAAAGNEIAYKIYESAY